MRPMPEACAHYVLNLHVYTIYIYTYFTPKPHIPNNA